MVSRERGGKCCCSSHLAYLVLAGHLNVVDRIRPEGELRPGGVCEQVAHETAAGYLPCDQALPGRVRNQLVPTDVGQHEGALALGVVYAQLKGRQLPLAVLPALWGEREKERESGLNGNRTREYTHTRTHRHAERARRDCVSRKLATQFRLDARSNQSQHQHLTH